MLNSSTENDSMRDRYMALETMMSPVSVVGRSHALVAEQWCGWGRKVMIPLLNGGKIDGEASLCTVLAVVILDFRRRRVEAGGTTLPIYLLAL